MDKKVLINKWLEGTLSPEERQKFEQMEEYASYQSIDAYAKHFSAPEFKQEGTWENLQQQLTTVKKQKSRKPYAIWSRAAAIAAIMIIGSYFLFFTASLTHIDTQIAEQKTIVLPDASEVMLNASSSLTYDEDTWDTNRTVTLEGEAFFKVAKGKTFSVKSEQGTVAVLGTQFNVKDRASEYKVETFEGLVAVTHKEQTFELPAGKGFQQVDNQNISLNPKVSSQPFWLHKKSQFTSTPVHIVLKELERQYHITVIAPQIDENKIFTGSFTHENIDDALKSITIPLQLVYKVNGDRVTLENL